MDLILLRHAAAVDRDPGRWPDDSTRPLSADGRRKFEAVARGIAALFPVPDAVLSSPYARAWETAAILEREAGWPPAQAVEVLTREEFAAWREQLMEVSGECVAIIGHEPQLSSFASVLLASVRRPFIELKKGGLLHLSGIALSGSDPDVQATLHAALPPRVLRAIAPTSRGGGKPAAPVILTP